MQIKMYIDHVLPNEIIGWAFREDGTLPDLSVFADGVQVGGSPTWHDRPDVAASLQSAPMASGFVLPVDTVVSGKNPRRQLSVVADKETEVVVYAPSREYLKFLRDIWAHFRDVQDFFPNHNATSKRSIDEYAKQNSPQEMLSIANHLYLLKAAGLEPDTFAEFGCFKGFSTSMLSYTCAKIGLQMMVFDSFEGLPAKNGSDYYQAGDFAGSLEEVKANVAEFGSPEVVTFHKGFFADSLPKTTVPPLLSLWMDVDLECSAKDVMTIFDKIHEDGAIFTHESYPAAYAGEEPFEVHGPNNVIAPILDAYKQRNLKAHGRFLYGNTGALWREHGIPVMDSDELIKLATR